MTLRDTTSIFHRNSENEVFYHGLWDRRSEATGAAVPYSSLMCLSSVYSALPSSPTPLGFPVWLLDVPLSVS